MILWETVGKCGVSGVVTVASWRAMERRSRRSHGCQTTYERMLIYAVGVRADVMTQKDSPPPDV